MRSRKYGLYLSGSSRYRDSMMFNPDFNDLLRLFTESSVKYVVVGAPLSGIAVEDFAVPDNVYQIGVPPNRIDILTSIDGLTYQEAGRITVEVGGLDIPFLDLESLERNKAATGRAKDKLDLELLRESDRTED